MNHMNISVDRRGEGRNGSSSDPESSSYVDDYDDEVAYQFSDMHSTNDGSSDGRGYKDKLSSTPSSLSSGSDSSHGATIPIIINFDDRSALAPVRRQLHYYSAKSPRMFGFSVAFIVLVIPLTIIILVLSLRNANRSKEVTYLKPNEDIKSSTSSPFLASNIHGAAAGDNKYCSQIAVSILQKGGNAVEAAIAGVLCQGVVSPGSSGIGGGAFILIYNSSSDSSNFIDSRETAPAGASENMFVGKPGASQNGGLAVATLGELRGLYAAFLKHSSGNLKWSELVMPAADMARMYSISPQFADVLHSSEALDALSPSSPFFELKKLFCRKDGTVKEAGDSVENIALSATLMQVASFGPDYLFKSMAATLAKEIQDAGGIVTAQDINNYTPVEHEPVSTSVLGHKFISASGSSSGGPVVAGILRFMGFSEQPLVSLEESYYHLLAEAFKHTFAMRMSLGDPAFVNITSVVRDFLGTKESRSQADDDAVILEGDYLYNLYKTYYDDRHVLKSSDEYGGDLFNHKKGNSNSYNKYDTRVNVKEDHGTSHFAVIDKNGIAVSITSTINTYLGSKVVSPSTGIIFNNQMDDFSTPNATNTYGLAPFSSNYPQPGKRPLSSMSPSIVLAHCDAIRGRPGCKQGNKYQVRLIGGASGGPRIITSTAQVILNFLARGMSILDSVLAPRIHCQLYPVTVRCENRKLLDGSIIRVPDADIQALLVRGQEVGVGDPLEGMGVSQFISVDIDPVLGEDPLDESSNDGSIFNFDYLYSIHAVSDPRKNGGPAAYR